jgi:hypothetical protein
MRPNELKETLAALFAVKRAVCVEGPPGGGKTTIVRQVAEELGVQYIEKHMPTMLVEDFGIPMPTDGKLVYTVPYWFPMDPDSQGILCFDDRNQANADLQKVLANIIQARELHGHKLPDGWMVISTGNRQEDRAGANRVLSHLRNRETVIPLDTHLDDWTTWALQNNIRPELVSFLRFKPDLLHKFDAKQDINPTPRSWAEGVAAIIDVVPKHAEMTCFQGAVGEGPAAEFSAFLKIFRNLPNPDAVLMMPDTADVPKDPAVLYAMSGALANRATPHTMDALVTYLDRMPKEFATLCMTMAIRRDKQSGKNELVQTGAFVRWTTSNLKVLF